MRGLLLAVLMGLNAEDGQAQQPMVYKCLVGEQHVYQAIPCHGIELRHWAVRSEDAVGPGADGKQSLRLETPLRDRSRSSRASSARRKNSGSVKSDPCAQARAGRERAYSKAGLKRDFAMSSYWDNKVHQACW